VASIVSVSAVLSFLMSTIVDSRVLPANVNPDHFSFEQLFQMTIFFRGPFSSQMIFGESFQSKLNERLNLHNKSPFQESAALGPKTVSKEIGS
jgi:hypothetical protein